MNAIREFVSRWHLRSLQKRVQPSARSFPADLKSPRRILVCLPTSLRELTLVKGFLPQVSSMFKSAEVSLLTDPGVKVHDIYPRRGYQILTATQDQVAWSGLPKASYLTALREYKFDMVIDFNLQFSYFTAAVLLAFPKAIRIGRGNHLGQPFYNVEIKTKYLRDERNIYRSMLEMIETIIGATDGKPAANTSS